MVRTAGLGLLERDTEDLRGEQRVGTDPTREHVWREEKREKSGES